ncbi:MAG: hypothetical protein F6K56_03395 [Moorea sp. SIO3G5]|nr:hypothetical protein [Moorena sp. SIO3G5]
MLLLGYKEHPEEEQIILRIKRRSEQLRERLPDHHEYLQQMSLKHFQASLQSLLSHSSQPMSSTIVR